MAVTPTRTLPVSDFAALKGNDIPRFIVWGGDAYVLSTFNRHHYVPMNGHVINTVTRPQMVERLGFARDREEYAMVRVFDTAIDALMFVDGY